MTSPAVRSRYANALVDVVLDPKSNVQAPDVARELRAFAAILADSAELRHALASPSVPTVRKRAVIGRIADQLGSGRITRNFLYVLNQHARMDALAAVVETFEEALDERLGFSRADVTSARELDEGQRQQLEAELGRLTGRRMRLKFSTDESLLGGVVARIGSTMYDGSVKGRLATLGRQLSAE
jgi:F-type H+-transporting ATPase subunit delta